MSFGNSISCCLKPKPSPEVVAAKRALETCRDSFKQVNWQDGRKIQTAFETADFSHTIFTDIKREHGYTTAVSERLGGAEDLSAIGKTLRQVRIYKVMKLKAKCVFPMNPQNTQSAWHGLNEEIESKSVSPESLQACGKMLQECIATISMARKPVKKVYKRMMNYKAALEGGADIAITGLEVTKTTSFVVAGTIATALTAGAATGVLGSAGVTNAMALHVASNAIGGGVSAFCVTFANMTATQFGQKMAGLRNDMDWKAIRSACIQQGLTGIIQGGLAQPLGDLASPFLGKQIMRLLSKVKVPDAVKQRLGNGLAQSFKSKATDAFTGATGNALSTCVAEAWTYASDPTSRKCYDACANIPETDDPSQFKRQCEIVGRKHRSNGEADMGSPGACEQVGTFHCQQKARFRDSCSVSGESWENDCLEKPGCSVGSQKTFVCILAFEMIKGAGAGIFYKNNQSLGALTETEGFKYIGNDAADWNTVLPFIGETFTAETAKGTAKKDSFLACR